MGELKKLKAKMLFWRVLKILFYTAGIPLLHYYVRLSVGDYPTGSEAFAGSGKTVLLILNISWAVVALVQIICAMVFKSKRTKAIIATIAAVAIVIAPIIFVEGFQKPAFEKVREDIKVTDGWEILTWEKLAIKYEDVAKDYNTNIDDFCKYYNIKYKSSQAGGNTDWDKENGASPTEYVEADDAFYSPNGMYSDGYIFGFKQARKVMEDYYNGCDAYPAKAADDKIFTNVNLALDKELKALNENSNSAWSRYKRGLGNDFVSSPDEYEKAYGKNGTALKYFVTEERLSAVLTVIGVNLSKSQLPELIKMVGAMYADILPLAAIADPNLNIEMVNKILVLLKDKFNLALPSSDVMELVSVFSNYQSPTSYPIMHFIKDDVLRNYAYARYYGITHGGKVGSVLISEAAKDPMVGQITFSASGNPAQSEWAIRDTFKKVDVGAKYIPQFLPWFCGRNFYYIFSGIVALAMIGAYACSYYEKKQLDKLVIKKEDNK